MKIKTIMDPLWILLLISCVSSDPMCPDECSCATGSSGPFAHCHGAIPHFSSFKTTLLHLNVFDANDMPFSLSPSYFSNSVLRKLVSLRIHNTSLTSVGDKTFDPLYDLYELDLSDNPQLYVFHVNAVSGAPELKILSMSGSMHLFNIMSGPIIRSNSLQELDLSRCGITEVHPKAFSLMEQLVYINLAENNIQSLQPQTFDQLLSLEELDLSGNHLSDLPSDMLAKNAELTVLKLRGNPITTIPDQIFGDNETILVELDISGTRLKNLSMPPMRELHILKLNGSHISSVDKLAMFPSLRHLNLSDTKVRSLEANTLAGNPHLETLLLSGNPSLRLPSMLKSELSTLYLLDLSNCNLKELNSEFFVQMKYIATLNLSQNALSDSASLGKALLPLSNLKILDLSFNDLRTIEQGDLQKKQGLTTLILTGNPLISPPSLEDLPSIRRLDLSRCSLQRLHLPTIFRQGPKLRYIYLAKNQLYSLYESSITEMEEDASPWKPPKDLIVLDLSDNAWNCEPPFTSLLYAMIREGVAPSENAPRNMVKQGYLRDLDAEWRLLEIAACENPDTEIEVTRLISDESPTEANVTMDVTLNAHLLYGSIIIMLMLLCILGVCVSVKLLKLRFKEKSTSIVKTPIASDTGKVVVSLVGPTSVNKTVRVKDYQRLHEDKSPNSPLTPRIYRPPPGATQFDFADPAFKDIEYGENSEEEQEDVNNDRSKPVP